MRIIPHLDPNSVQSVTIAIFIIYHFHFAPSTPTKLVHALWIFDMFSFFLSKKLKLCLSYKNVLLSKWSDVALLRQASLKWLFKVRRMSSGRKRSMSRERQVAKIRFYPFIEIMAMKLMMIGQIYLWKWWWMVIISGVFTVWSNIRYCWRCHHAGHENWPDWFMIIMMIGQIYLWKWW